MGRLVEMRWVVRTVRDNTVCRDHSEGGNERPLWALNAPAGGRGREAARRSCVGLLGLAVSIQGEAAPFHGAFRRWPLVMGAVSSATVQHQSYWAHHPTCIRVLAHPSRPPATCLHPLPANLLLRTPKGLSRFLSFPSIPLRSLYPPSFALFKSSSIPVLPS